VFVIDPNNPEELKQAIAMEDQSSWARFRWAAPAR